MAFVEGRCPKCKKTIVIPHGVDQCFCLYCGAKISVADALLKGTFTKRPRTISSAPVAFNKNSVVTSGGLSNSEQAFSQPSDFIVADGVLTGYCGTTTKIIVPAEITVIGRGAFQRLPIETVVLSGLVERIEELAFESSTFLTAINLPDSLLTIGESAFDGCVRLNPVVLPKNLKRIGKRAFSGCAALTEIELPASVTSLGDWAFSNCNALSRVRILGPVDIIPNNTFRHCKKLREIDICKGTIVHPETIAGALDAPLTIRYKGALYQNRRELRDALVPPATQDITPIEAERAFIQELVAHSKGGEIEGKQKE